MRLAVKYSRKDGIELPSAYESRPLKPISRVACDEGGWEMEIGWKILQIFA